MPAYLSIPVVVVSTFRLHHCIALQLLGITTTNDSAPLTCLPLCIHNRRSQDWICSIKYDPIGHRPTQTTHNNRQCSHQVCDHYCYCPSPCERHSLKQHKPATTAPNYAAGNTTTLHILAPTTVHSCETRQQPGAHPATSSTTAQSNCKPASACLQRKSTQRTEHGASAIAAAICSTPAR